MKLLISAVDMLQGNMKGLPSNCARDLNVSSHKINKHCHRQQVLLSDGEWRC